MSRYILHCAVFALFAAVGIAVAQEAKTPKGDAGAPAAADQGGGQDIGDRLIRGLKETEGCLGVKTCNWPDGMQSIFAWFENKNAAETWFWSDVHQQLVEMVGGLPDDHVPMRHVSDDDDQPMMVIASLTPSKKPGLEGVPFPISQISIELFSAAPGGAFSGGRLSPPAFKVPHMKGYETPTTTGGGSD